MSLSRPRLCHCRSQPYRKPSRHSTGLAQPSRSVATFKFQTTPYTHPHALRPPPAPSNKLQITFRIISNIIWILLLPPNRPPPLNPLLPLLHPRLRIHHPSCPTHTSAKGTSPPPGPQTPNRTTVNAIVNPLGRTTRGSTS